MKSIEDKLNALDLGLPPLSPPLANYVPFVLAGNLPFLAAQGPRTDQGERQVGRVGESLSVDEDCQHARLVGLNMLAAARSALGSLDRVERVVKLTGFVNSTSDFADYPKVINGCSDLLVNIFGEVGRYARSAVGVSNLPLGISVEIEASFQVR